MPLHTLDETIAGYMEYRIHTFAMLALFSFVEYAYELQIPDDVFKNPSIMKLEQIGIEIQIFVNDCVSYHREKVGPLICPKSFPTSPGPEFPTQ
ncbi:hypothetical protein IFR04_007276 [Cadophora malorum]|uniref:Terpene synthase n=1 Tax=Cadophora malorum TaxID=108018 RepID=A0A8H7TH28_9HELO|nr:hypothetical protein IFR04_007276 [Cadophora malorum]